MDENNYIRMKITAIYSYLYMMPHECGTSKTCQSAHTASSERAQWQAAMAHPIERSI